MCRAFTRSTTSSRPPSEEEARAAALQYVRKISGYRKPSRANEEAFERAVDEIAEISWRLLGELETNAAPRVREHVHASELVGEQMAQEALRIVEERTGELTCAASSYAISRMPDSLSSRIAASG